MFKSFQKPAHLYLGLTIIFSVISFYQLVRPGFFPMQDDLQAFRVEQMVKCLKDFQIPCRWIPDMGYQYGYPQFNFYGPTPFYLGAAFNLIGIQVIDTVKILFVLGFILSAVSMFIFLKSLLDEKAAFVGAVLYTYAPFKAAEVYVRGSLSEFLTFIFLPLLFWSSYQFFAFKKGKYLIWFALVLAALLTTHNLTSLIFIPILFVWILTLGFLNSNWKGFAKLILGFLLGGGISAFFVLPLLFEKSYVHLETLTSGYFDYRQHFVSVYQMFISNFFGYGSSVFGLNDGVSLSTGQVHWAFALLALVLSFVSYKKNKKLSILVWTLSVLELFVLFMMHQKSSFIWEKLNFLTWLQFPWRFLVDSVFLLSVLSGISINLVSKINKKLSLALGILAIILVIILHGGFFQPREWLNISDAEKFSGASWEKQLTISIFDYLPIYAKFPPTHKAGALPEVLQGEVSFMYYKKGSDYQTSNIVVKKDAVLRLPLFDYPGMKVLVDGKTVDHNHDDCINEEFCLGLISFKVPVGDHLIKAELTNTPVRTFGNLISVLSIVLIFVLLSKRDEKLS